MVALKRTLSDNISPSLIHCEGGEEQSQVYKNYRVIVKSNGYARC